MSLTFADVTGGNRGAVEEFNKVELRPGNPLGLVLLDRPGDCLGERVVLGIYLMSTAGLVLR